MTPCPAVAWTLPASLAYGLPSAGAPWLAADGCTPVRPLDAGDDCDPCAGRPARDGAWCEGWGDDTRYAWCSGYPWPRYDGDASDWCTPCADPAVLR